jgi:hypothetical protein
MLEARRHRRGLGASSAMRVGTKSPMLLEGAWGQSGDAAEPLCKYDIDGDGARAGRALPVA